MKKVLRRIIVIGLALLAGWLYRERTASSTIGIIGGADGPTSVFVTGSTAPSLFTIVILAFIIIATVFLIVRRLKKK